MDRDERLWTYVETWWRAVDDLTTLLDALPPAAWHAATDLPGWDVHAVAAHSAHLEAVAAGAAHDDGDVSGAAHVRGALGVFTEQGVQARRDRTPDQLITELRQSATTRHTALLADPPTDPDAAAPGPFGAIGWTAATLLRNRPLDVWMHEQDIRRAVDRPGNLDSPAAGHTIDYFAEAMPIVMAKRAGAGPGTTLTLDVAGHPARAYAVDPDGRGRTLAEPPATPTVGLALDAETFILLAGGRRASAADAVRVEGDQGLGRAVLARLAVTP